MIGLKTLKSLLALDKYARVLVGAGVSNGHWLLRPSAIGADAIATIGIDVARALFPRREVGEITEAMASGVLPHERNAIAFTGVLLPGNGTQDLAIYAGPRGPVAFQRGYLEGLGGGTIPASLYGSGAADGPYVDAVDPEGWAWVIMPIRAPALPACLARLSEATQDDPQRSSDDVPTGEAGAPTVAPDAQPMVAAEPGVKYLRPENSKPWYGPGYCGVCGHRGEELIPRAVRFWDPDDGWKVGVLCTGCTEECMARGPRADDYAVVTRTRADAADRIDVAAEHTDLDGTYSDGNE